VIDDDDDGPGRHGIARRVALLVMLGIVAPTLVLGWLGTTAVLELERHVVHERQTVAANLAERLDRSLEGDMAALAAAGNWPRFDTRDEDPRPESDALHAAWMKATDLGGVFLLDPAGERIAEEPRGLTAGEDLAGLLALAGRPPRPLVTNLQQRVGTGPRIYVLAPVLDWRGRIAAIAGGVLDPADHGLGRLLTPRFLGPHTTADLLDANDRVLVSSERPAAADGASSAEPASVSLALRAAPWRLVLRESSEGTQGRLRLRDQLLVAVPVLVGVGLLFSLGAARSLLQPLGRLSEAAGRIARGEIDRALPDLGADEIGQLGRSFESMRLALQRSFAEVREANERLEARVKERTQQLEALYGEIREHDEARGRLLRKVISAQEEERKRIARELHDETCQMISAVGMSLDTALSAPAPPEVRQRVEDARALAHRTLSGVHELILDLRPSVLDDLGLVPAIRWLATRHLTPLGVSVRCELEEMDRRIPVEMETALFRVVQEVLTNVARHARAESVLIQLSVEANTLEIEIEDDGEGFVPEHVVTPQPGGRGLGLMGLRERVELLGGSVRIDSAPGRGARVLVRVPLPERPA
jgi:signal transduction histidine kinase